MDMTYSQRYYQENKERITSYINEKTQCECGAVVSRLNMAKHKRTNKHENRMRHNKFLQDQQSTQ